MEKNYPPYTITDKMLNYVSDIMKKIGEENYFENLNKYPELRRKSRIRSIHSSLAIENNQLSLFQVEDVINGKPVIGEQKDIQEVKNAYKAYEMIEEFDGYNEKDLLKAHGILTYLLDSESGKYRNHAEGVKDGENIIFIAPPEDLVPKLMNDLFKWLKEDNETPILIKSCIFHYEFVFIHPFNDGNGRTARLWQNILLSKWNKIFEFLPIESQIKKYQEDYYKAISNSHVNGNSNTFIEFMLKMIDETLFETLESTKKETKNISEQVNKLLEIMDYDIPLSANEIMKRLNIKSKETLRNSYLNPAIKNGLIKMMLPYKPNSKNQKYYKL